MNKKLIAILLLTILILTACRIKENPDQFDPTKTPLTLSAKMNTNTPQSTKKPTNYLPTATMDIQSLMTQRAEDILQAEIDTFPSTCENSWYQVFSPDHSLLARDCSYDHQEENQTLEIVIKEGQKWKLQFNDYLTEEFISAFHEFLGGDAPVTGELVPIKWSQDGKYLYFGSHIYYIGADGPNFFGRSYNGIYRINVETGYISTILPPSPTPNGYFYSFSPNGRWLAYGKDQPFILDIYTGQNIALETKGFSYNFSWSPDSSKIAFVYNYNTIEIFSIETKIRNKLEFENSSLSIFPMEKSLGVDVLNEYTGEFDQFYQYDWSSNVLTQITLTPTPAK